jgi:hypothetical protein
MAGDYNVMPTDLDVYAPERWRDDALFRPEVRGAYAEFVKLGWSDTLRELNPGKRIYTFWKYFRNAFARDAGLRIDHLLLSPALKPRLVSGGVAREARGWEKTSDHAPAAGRHHPEAFAPKGESLMPRKLKTYQASLGFFDLSVAAPSMKAVKPSELQVDAAVALVVAFSDREVPVEAIMLGLLRQTGRCPALNLRGCRELRSQIAADVRPVRNPTVRAPDGNVAKFGSADELAAAIGGQGSRHHRNCHRHNATQ